MTDGDFLPPSRGTAVLVHDDRGVVSDILEILRAAGLTVIEARSAQGAESALRDHPAAVAFVRLPVDWADGPTLVSKLRQPSLARTPVVVLADRVLPDLPPARAYELGVIDYLTGPPDPTALQAKVAGLAALAGRFPTFDPDATHTLVAGLLAESPGVTDALPGVLRVVCEGFKWTAGAVWALDRQAGELRCLHTWTAPEETAGGFQAASRRLVLKIEEGLPGRVLTNGAPVWVEDVTIDPHFVRAADAAASGLQTACGVPIRVGGETVGVMEFFARAVRKADPSVLQALTAASGQVGQYLERRAAAVALRKSEARKAAVLEAALDGIITIDHAGRVIELNPAAERLFGYAADEAIGQDVADLIVPPGLRDQHYRGLARYLATGEGTVLGRRIEMPAVRRDGTLLTVELAIVPISDHPPLFTGYVRDLTTAKQAEAERSQLLERERAARADAEAAVRSRDQFLRIASHELRTPLNPLQLNIQFLARAARENSLDRLPRAAVAELLGSCEVQVRRFARLVSDLLDVSRLASGRLELRVEEVDLAVVAREIVERHFPEAAAAGCSLRLRADAPVVGRWDRVRADQVLTNLLRNALKYGRGSPVEVIVSADRSTASLVVIDKGIGIDPADHERIFERFERAAPGHGYEGLGMGLYIVRRLCSALGGSVAVASVPGQGATFTVSLPLAGPEPNPHAG